MITLGEVLVTPMVLRREKVRRSLLTLLGETAPEPPEEEPGDLVSSEALDLVLRVGELLLASGEATERVNESMLSLAVAYELPRCEVAVTFTVISVSVHPGHGALPVTGARAIRRRNPAYWRLVALHALIQEASIGLLDLEEAHDRLRKIKRNRPPYGSPYPPWLGVVAFGLIAATSAVMMGGGALVAATAFVATVLADRAAALLGRRGVAEFFQLTVAAGIGATSAVLVIAAGAAANAALIVTGAIVALLPGRPLVASIQDGITGDLVSASARLLEVFVIVSAIVSGLGVTVYAAVHLGVPIDVKDLPAAPVSLRPVAVLAAAAVSVTFAVSLAVPRRVLPAAALGGALIWTVYVLARGLGSAPLLAAAVGAVLVGLLGHLLARRRHLPALPYIVPAIAPLLPGTALYRGMIQLNGGAPSEGVLTLIGGISVALALGAGVNLGGEFVRAFQRVGVGGSGRGARPAARRTRGY
jgi:uncharacterized membrane protein YjjP (DUF1212 family)